MKCKCQVLQKLLLVISFALLNKFNPVHMVDLCPHCQKDSSLIQAKVKHMET